MHNMEPTPSRSCELKRPWDFDEIPQEHQDILDANLPPGWPGFFGQWAVEENTRAAVLEEVLDMKTHDFTLGSRMSASALAVDLLRTGKPFTCTPNGNRFVFTVTPAVLQYIQVHLEEMVGGLGSVTG